MGEVYEATDTGLGTRVALKTVRLDQAANERTLQRFRREILLARKIGHPNVCRVFELHLGGPGEPPVFLTMELLEGETLAERLRRKGRLPESEANKIVLNILSALLAAHGEGVVHRDLKASNVMIVPVPGAGERAVVTDFGIAHALGSFSDVTATLDPIIGTPAYMAPEQVTGGAVTPATDLYALGVMMFEMTSGRLPFSGDTPLALASSRLQSSPPSLRRTIPGVSRAWSDATAWCLEREPGRRPKSADAVVAVLEGARQHWHGAAWRTGAVFAVCALLLGFGIVGVRRWRRPLAPPVRPVAAVLEAANLTGDGRNDWLSTAIPELLTSDLEPIVGVRLVPARTVAERQFSLGAATAPNFAGADEPRRLAESVGGTFLVVPSIRRGEGEGLLLELRVRRPGAEPALATMSRTMSAHDPDPAIHKLADELRRAMRWQAGAPGARSPLIAAHPLPENTEARRAAVEGIRAWIHYDFVEARFQLLRALQVEPGFLAGIPPLVESEFDGRLPRSRDQAERALELLSSSPDVPERRAVEIAALSALDRPDEAAERVKELLDRQPDDFELMLLQANVAPEPVAFPQLQAMRALPSPLGKDPRIDLSESENRGGKLEIAEALRAIDRGVEEARRRGDRMVIAQFLSLRAMMMLRLARLDEMTSTYLEAEREALAAGSSGYARQNRKARAGWLQASGRSRAAASLYRQLLGELPALGEGWRAKQWEILLGLASVEDDMGHMAMVKELIPRLKASNPPPSTVAGTIRMMEISEGLRSTSAAERERLLRQELRACDQLVGCRLRMATALSWELLDQRRGAEAESTLAELGEGARRGAARLYAHVMAENGKAAQAYAVLQPLMRADTQLLGEIGAFYPWQQTEALATCLLGMGEYDQAAALVHRLASFHRTTEILWIRSAGLVLEADLAVGRGFVPPELPGLLQQQLAMEGMESLPGGRTELRMQLGRVLTRVGRQREGERELSVALRESTARGNLRVARLARLALQRP
jgi:tetratricopeptide (TPR) repeat protein